MSNIRSRTESSENEIIDEQTTQTRLAERWASIVDAADTNILVTTPDRKIAFLNTKAIEIINSLEEELGVNSEELIGSPIETLFGSSAKELRNKIKDVRNLPLRTEITFNECTLALTISSVVSSEGNPLRFVGDVRRYF